MTIAHFIASNFFGGPEKQILNSAQSMHVLGIRPIIISFFENGSQSEIVKIAANAGVEVFSLRNDFAFNPSCVVELIRILRNYDVDILVCHGYKANVIGRMSSWASGVPLLAVSRGWTSETWKICLYETLDKFFLRLANQVVAVSQGQRDKILRVGIGGRKVEVIHNAINLADIPGKNPSLPERKRLGVPDDAFLIGTAGRLSPEKNHLGLIEAAAEVARFRNDIYFVVWGEGFLRPTLEKAVAEMGLAERFLLPGFSKDVLCHFHELDVFVLPSHTEGLSNVLLEAYACAKPAVATAVGGNPEVVEHGNTGLLTPQGDSKALAKAILQLVEDPSARHAMGQAGRRRVEMNFDFASQTQKYLRLYQCLIQAKKASA